MEALLRPWRTNTIDAGICPADGPFQFVPTTYAPERLARSDDATCLRIRRRSAISSAGPPVSAEREEIPFSAACPVRGSARAFSPRRGRRTRDSPPATLMMPKASASPMGRNTTTQKMICSVRSLAAGAGRLQGGHRSSLALATKLLDGARRLMCVAAHALDCLN